VRVYRKGMGDAVELHLNSENLRVKPLQGEGETPKKILGKGEVDDNSFSWSPRNSDGAKRKMKTFKTGSERIRRDEKKE